MKGFVASGNSFSRLIKQQSEVPPTSPQSSNVVYHKRLTTHREKKKKNTFQNKQESLAPNKQLYQCVLTVFRCFAKQVLHSGILLILQTSNFGESFNFSGAETPQKK